MITLKQLFSKTLGLIFGKNSSFTKLLFEKGDFYIRSPFALQIARDIVEYTNRSDYSEKYNQLCANISQGEKDIVDRFLKNIHLIRENNVLARSVFFDAKQIEQKNNYSRFDHKDLHPTGYYLEEKTELKAYLEDKIILDCGSFDGSDALLFDKTFPNHSTIFTFEPSEDNYFNRVIPKINKAKTNGLIVPSLHGVGEKNETLYFSSGNGEASQIITTPKEGQNYEKINVVSIDSFLKNNADQSNGTKAVGLIKRDIEGHEIQSILGAKKTIVSDKPILLISIYHNGKQFFETKSLIESLKLGYTCSIIDAEPHTVFSGVLLVCIPESIENTN